MSAITETHVTPCFPAGENPHRSVDDMTLGECAHFDRCKNRHLAVLLSERGLCKGTSMRLCWRASLGDVLCVEVLSSRFSLRCREAQAMLLADA